MSSYFSTSESESIVSIISDLERTTIGEIRIHVEDLCAEDPYLRAIDVFNKLGMYKTIDQTGVLIYVAFEDKKLAVIGDSGINSKLDQNYWVNIVDQMSNLIKSDSLHSAIVYGLRQIGKELNSYFPEMNKPVNELSNEISYGKI